MIALSEGVTVRQWRSLPALIQKESSFARRTAGGGCPYTRQFGKCELRGYFEDRARAESAARLAGAVEVAS